MAKSKKRRWFNGVFLVFLFLFLTAWSQVGGLCLLVSMAVYFGWMRSRLHRRWMTLFFMLTIAAVHALTSILLIPKLAPLFGRVSIYNKSEQLKPHNFATILANRHYLKPGVANAMVFASHRLSKDQFIIFLDAGFPFMDGFPIFPHLGHRDGRKIDLCFQYLDNKSGKYSAGAPSVLGYGVYEKPLPNEVDQINQCVKAGYWQYDPTRYWFTSSNTKKKFSAELTKDLIESLISSNAKKIFIEPYLKQRLSLTQSEIRFHGCRAVRHDDHLHVEF